MPGAQTILVIDDDPALSAAYSEELRKLGYVVKVASDGADGAKQVEANPPSAILLDMLMPNLGGVGFLQQLRGNPKTKDIKVVVVSNFESPPGTEGLGIAKYLSKMQNSPEAVASAVDRIIKG